MVIVVVVVVNVVVVLLLLIPAEIWRTLSLCGGWVGKWWVV